MKLIVFLFFIFLPVVSWADTHTADSCSYADVLAAYNAASAGDIVVIPPGNNSWSSTLTIFKELTLQGGGKTSTTITNSGANPLVDIDPRSDVPVRVTSICFDNSSYVDHSAIEISGSKTSSFELTQIRIDNCKFNTGKRAVHAIGWVEGVIDNNEFLNCEIAIGITGDNTDSFSRPITAGTGDFLFIENNTFTADNDFPTSQNDPEQQIYQQEGARSVTRYNTFDGSNYTNGHFHCYDSHGNQDYYSENPNGIRGQPIIEIYENIMRAYKSYRMVDFRGGSFLFFNNTMTTETGTAPYIDVTEEESWSTSHFPSGLDDTWSAEDQINNSFIWGNTSNALAFNADKIVLRNSSDEVFIQKDRDFFLHAPQSTGGKSIYSGRVGGDLTFSSGPNAYYPYTPYTYPHPLRNEASQIVPGQVTGLHPERPAEPISGFTLVLKWSAPTTGGAVTGYNIYYSLKGDDFPLQPNTVVSNPSTTQSTLSGFQAEETYIIIIRAYNDTGEGQDSSHFEFKALGPPPFK